MTFWVTQTTWNGDTEPSKATYRYTIADNKDKGSEASLLSTAEKAKIVDTVKFAQKHIFEVHRLMKRKNIIIENLDYKELIKKYNGLSYTTVGGETMSADESLGKKNKLWYFDPPYHPATLAGGLEAPYEDTFTIDLAKEMTEVLHNGYTITDEELQAEPDGEKREQKRNLAKHAEVLREVYGELKHFIKSDYDPKWCYDQEVEKLEAMKAKAGTPTGEAKANIKKSEERVVELEAAYHDFDVLEENIAESSCYIEEAEKRQYIKIEVGEFDKGGFVKDGEDNVVKTKGKEFIWCRG